MAPGEVRDEKEGMECKPDGAVDPTLRGNDTVTSLKKDRTSQDPFVQVMETLVTPTSCPRVQIPAQQMPCHHQYVAHMPHLAKNWACSPYAAPTDNAAGSMYRASCCIDA